MLVWHSFQPALSEGAQRRSRMGPRLCKEPMSKSVNEKIEIVIPSEDAANHSASEPRDLGLRNELYRCFVLP